jgi:hypothetical protein
MISILFLLMNLLFEMKGIPIQGHPLSSSDIRSYSCNEATLNIHILMNSIPIHSVVED